MHLDDYIPIYGGQNLKVNWIWPMNLEVWAGVVLRLELARKEAPTGRRQDRFAVPKRKSVWRGTRGMSHHSIWPRSCCRRGIPSLRCRERTSESTSERYQLALKSGRRKAGWIIKNIRLMTKCSLLDSLKDHLGPIKNCFGWACSRPLLDAHDNSKD